MSILKQLVVRLAFEHAAAACAEAMSSVVDERIKQDVQWGGPEHDDKHDAAEWVSYVGHQLNFIVESGMGGKPLRRGEFRERMVKVAALAVAAIQSYDRVTAADAAVAANGQSERCGECPACRVDQLLKFVSIDDLPQDLQLLARAIKGRAL